MGITDRERQALGSIEHRLACSDPTLASMLAIFGRLTVGEAMPAREKIRAPRRRTARSGHRSRRRARSGTVLRPPGRLRLHLGWEPAMLSLWLIVSVGLLAVALVLNAGGHGACAQFIGTVCRG